MKLKLFNEMNQMATLGYVCPSDKWERYVDTTDADTRIEIFVSLIEEGYDEFVSKLVEL